MKYNTTMLMEIYKKSPPSRGAWIEIAKNTAAYAVQYSRPPRGGRGLKCLQLLPAVLVTESPPSRGAWIEINIIK